MLKYVLVVWLVNPSNYAIVDEFKTKEQCFEKLAMYKKALTQAESKMVPACWERISN